MTPTDYNLRRIDVAGPGRGSFAVTPHDTNPLADDNGIEHIALALYVEVAGDVCFVGPNGHEDTWTVPDNFLLPVACRIVKATGTDATGIHAII